RLWYEHSDNLYRRCKNGFIKTGKMINSKYRSMMKRNIVLGLLVIFSFFSCEKMLDIDSTRTVSEENMWSKLEDTRAALMGVYGLTQAAMADHNAHWLYGDVRAGEFASPNRQDLKAIIENDLNGSYPSLEALSNWRRWYAVVNAANIFLERVNEVKSAD